MKPFYQMSKEELFSQFQTDGNGLTSEQAKKKLDEVGRNALKEAKKKSTLQVFLEQFADLLVLILIVAAVISMISGNIESTIVIFVVIVLNAVLGTVQYVKAEKSLDSLKALSSPHAKVLRDGRKMEIESELVVPGDILCLEAGDMIVADGRILQNYSLQVNESSLTGESTNVDKTDQVLEGKTLKVIIETCLLTDDEKRKACELSEEAGADFVKTSTGFSTGGATVEDVALMRSVVGDRLGVKASGGIRDYRTAKAMIEAGATRIGASSGIRIVEEQNADN